MDTSQQAGPSRLPAPSSSASNVNARQDRLFIGNLAPTVDEYTLLQVFSKFGKITKLDLMFHKTGVLKGKPRGYAFVEYVNKDDAQKAMTKLHDRLLRGRKLVVTSANSAPVSEIPHTHSKGRRTTEAPKTTTLSLLKSKKHPQSADAQIAAMEAKLAAMARTKPADEDYIPGKSPYLPLITPTGSGSASPAPDDPVLYYRPELEDEDGVASSEEQGMTDDQVKREAEELERDFMSELEKEKTVKSEDVEKTPPSTRSDGKMQLETQSAFQKGLASLPKRPAF